VSLMELTANTIAKQRMTCLMTTHDLDDALRYGNRLIALKDGEIAFEAQAHEKQKLAKQDLLQFCY